MFSGLLSEHSKYENFTPEHYWALVVFVIFTASVVYLAKKYANKKQQWTIALLLSLIPFLSIMARMLIRYYFFGFSVQEDLPLHLCRILAVIAPFIVLLNRQKVLKIFYYLALAGVLNAMITADIIFSFPHYGYFIFWLYHGGLVTLAIYGLLTFKTRLSIKDGLHAFFTINVYFILLHMINLTIDSNYMYSRFKPSVASLMDFLGAWPYYLLWLELMALLMIAIIYFVFDKVHKYETNRVKA